MDITRMEFLRMTAGSATLLAAGGLGAIADAFAADAPLLTRKVPKTGEVLPLVGLGTAQTFGDVLEGEGFEQRKNVIKAHVDNGGVLIDTSPTYSGAEAVIGKAMRELGNRNKIYISTKISIDGEKAGIDQFNKSLKDLGTDHVELLHIHNLRDFDTHLKTVRRMKDEGKAKAIGATHFQERGFEPMIKVMKTANLDWIQINYAIDDRGAEKDILPLAKDLGMGVMLNLPFGRDRLFDKVKGKDVPQWAVKDLGCDTWAKFFLKYLISNDAVTCAIPGTTFPHHVPDNLGAARGRLPDEATRKKMAALIDSY
jgi:aryl-alcohol dehydrogenase-like predicted oxidoreductase